MIARKALADMKKKNETKSDGTKKEKFHGSQQFIDNIKKRKERRKKLLEETK